MAVGVSKPVPPIWSLTLKEFEACFSNMKSEIAKDDGVKLKPKWPKIFHAGGFRAPTKITTFDEVVESILPSSMYVPYHKKILPWEFTLAPELCLCLLAHEERV